MCPICLSPSTCVVATSSSHSLPPKEARTSVPGDASLSWDFKLLCNFYSYLLKKSCDFVVYLAFLAKMGEKSFPALSYKSLWAILRGLWELRYFPLWSLGIYYIMDILSKLLVTSYGEEVHLVCYSGMYDSSLQLFL